MIVSRAGGRPNHRRPILGVPALTLVSALAMAGLAGCGIVGPTTAADPDPGPAAAPPTAGAPPAEPGTMPDFESLGELAEVRVRVVIPAAGVDETLSLTIEEIFAPNGQDVRLAACGPFHATAGLLADVYSVSIVDTGASGAIARFEVIPTGEVTGPGEYPAIGSVQGTDGQSFPLDGTLTVHSGLMAGEFALRDPSGNPVTGDYACQTS